MCLRLYNQKSYPLRPVELSGRERPHHREISEREAHDTPPSKEWEIAMGKPDGHRVRKTMTARLGRTFEAMA